MSQQAAEKLMTADEFIALPESGEFVYELIQGVLVEMPRPGARHGKLMSIIDRRLGTYVEQNKLGEVIADAGFLLNTPPDTVRAPDIAYLGPAIASQADNPKFMTTAPDIAVEVNSPNDVMSEVLDKARWWLGQGTKQVWVVDDPTSTVTVYFPDGRARVYGEEDSLDAGETLPGFVLPLKELFG